jgi:hypothetical protein
VRDGKRLYLVLISLHGLVRGHEMELGRDSDTGGQVKYVVELSRALAKHPGVHRVDLLTRLITGARERTRCCGSIRQRHALTLCTLVAATKKTPRWTARTLCAKKA